MTKPSETRIETREGTPESFGYVRCPLKDTSNGIAYEAPDGRMHLFEKGKAPRIVAWQRPEMGKKR